MIKGGYVLKPRKIKNSDISDASPCVRETWDYLIREANHKPFERGSFRLERGQLFRSYDEILDDLCWYVGWRKETYTKNQMKQAMKYLRDTERITTQKKPGGVLITVCNYCTYQDPSNYEETSEETNEETIEKPSTNHEETSHNYKNVKNVKNKPYSEDFEEFWELYDVKKGKKKAWLEWKNLSVEAKEEIMENVPIFLTHFSTKQYTPRPRKYLYNRYWEDEDYQKPQKDEDEKKERKYTPITNGSDLSGLKQTQQKYPTGDELKRG